ncbi:MAG TPA: NAD(P)/FAD-dependent oxidoreductase, partial [Acidimicrobiales bacterium]|nr:NAD(P)/FAD-dependent oxidoreductase [Acidimicrobiales bacterium]
SERFSEELLEEWEWSERYPSQPEILRYLQWVSDRLDLRRDIRLGTRVQAAAFDEDRARWEVSTEGGDHLSARYLIPAVGALSRPMVPDLPGLERFAGEWCHSARLPEGGLDLDGKRVAVVGNGATAVQIVPEIAQSAAEVWEFVRHPYHCIPGRNHQLDADDWRDIHDHHDEIWAQARENFLGFPYPDFKGVGDDFAPEERRRMLEEYWLVGGFPFGLSTFADVIVNQETNQMYLDFFGEKIRNTIRNPEAAAVVTPTEPFASKRPPIEHGYYEAFNRPNVHAVDLKASPITEVTESGINAGGTEYPVDVIILATGFDAFTGSLVAMDIRGRGGRSLRDEWADGPRNLLGLMAHGFPNLFMLYCGPFNPAILINAPTLIEQQGDWIAECIAHMDRHGHDAVEPTREAEDAFLDLHEQVAAATVIPGTASWWTGTNVEGKWRRVLSWCGGFPEYRRLCDEAAANGYQSFEMKALAAR